MAIDTTTLIRLLTSVSLAGLLLAVGLRLRAADVLASLRRIRLGWILAANFVAVPAFVLALTRVFHLSTDVTVGMILLGAAPFAPVVPVFARMARADLALAAGLTALFPFLSAFLTPVLCEFSLRTVSGAESLTFNPLTILVSLVSTITLPMAAGVALNHWLPVLGQRVLRPMEVISEAAGALSLTFVTLVEWPSVIVTGWKPLLAMALGSELALLLGYGLGGPTTGTRVVTALGTSNRNIALAILVAIDSFRGTPIVAAVVANGLLLIFLGLVHVAFWRFFSSRKPQRNPPILRPDRTKGRFWKLP
jgi:BASS family bile acid:Na+ symporter